MSTEEIPRTLASHDPTGAVAFELDDSERDEVESLLREVVARYGTATSAEFLECAEVWAQELPRRLREFMVRVKLSETAPAFVISGFTVNDADIGPTPDGWQGSSASNAREEMWLLLCASLLGDVFGWATQQDGALVHNIAPQRGHEQTQLGTGSVAGLWWHTEEAFHPLRCDYLALLCMRNPDRVPTTFSSLVAAELDEEVLACLREPMYVIRPDDSHLERAQAAGSVDDEQTEQLQREAAGRINHMQADPELVPVLYGALDAPYLAIDPYYMQVVDDDPRGVAALEAVSAVLDANLREVALGPGEILFVDNFRAVHGRASFQPRFDGTDRWLKRVNITRDLRKSRRWRADSGSRVVH